MLFLPFFLRQNKWIIKSSTFSRGGKCSNNENGKMLIKPEIIRTNYNLFIRIMNVFEYIILL